MQAIAGNHYKNLVNGGYNKKYAVDSTHRYMARVLLQTKINEEAPQLR